MPMTRKSEQPRHHSRFPVRQRPPRTPSSSGQLGPAFSPVAAMVSRKPLSGNAATDHDNQPGLRTQDVGGEPWSDTDAEDTSEQIWGNRQQHIGATAGMVDQAAAMRGATPSDGGSVPSSLRPGGPASFASITDESNVWDEGPAAASATGASSSSDVVRIPSVLRPGVAHKEAVEDMGQGEQSAQQVNRIPTVLRPAGGALRSETNPFKRKPVSPGGGPGGPRESATGASTPIDPPPAEAYASSFSQLSLSEPSRNPWQPALDDRKDTLGPPPISGVPEQDSGQDVWVSGKNSRQPSPGPASNSPALLSLPSEGGSAVWDDEGPRKIPPPTQPLGSPDDEVFEDSHAWDDLGTLDKGKAPVQAASVPNAGSAGSGDEWNLIDIDGPRGPPSRQSTWENFADAEENPASPPERPTPPERQEQPPSLPPRRSQDARPPQPPRPVSKSETYQIKNINWYDIKAAKNPRTSPVLVQNANGPCPLVALVNALTLTTPADMSGTALVETLRSREQVSLGLLLDAVFDELIRRNDPDVPLPDVTELYDFLKGLHTGMNVNPRFIPATDLITAFKRTSLTHIHPTERGDLIPGSFEATREMAMYSTFSIPLYHGWLPAKDEPAYASFARQAVSYEDAQNLLFREEELEEKLSSTSCQGLSEEEQQVYQDILTIKSFLSISATQLTPCGLEVVTKAMEPGSVSILFRNDHFSTLYRHPQTLQLLGLVTDAGYATHDEVVWESLVDVNGERAEFFSGDFRLVGGANQDMADATSPQRDSRNGDDWAAPGAATASSPSAGNSWSTAQHRRVPSQARSQDDEVPLSPSTEQEDRDLALALQLQEEEDERHRAEQERRNRESMLSEQFIEQQARTQPPSSRGRGGARGGAALGSRGSSRGSSTSTLTGRRSSSGITIPVTTIPTTGARGRGGARGGTSARASPPTRGSSISARGGGGTVRGPAPAARGGTRGGIQGVRSLLPPRGQGVNRPAEDGLDDAPPSYEQAAQQDPYVPPEGHPSHPTSSPDRQSAASGQRRQTPPPPINAAPTGRQPGGVPGYPGVGGPGRMRPGMPPTAVTSTAGSGRDRDCVVM